MKFKRLQQVCFADIFPGMKWKADRKQEEVQYEKGDKQNV